VDTPRCRARRRRGAHRWGRDVGNLPMGRRHRKLLSLACWSIHRGGSPARWRMRAARRRGGGW
jgi:hypothetical protein